MLCNASGGMTSIFLKSWSLVCLPKCLSLFVPALPVPWKLGHRGKEPYSGSLGRKIHFSSISTLTL